MSLSDTNTGDGLFGVGLGGVRLEISGMVVPASVGSGNVSVTGSAVIGSGDLSLSVAVFGDGDFFDVDFRAVTVFLADVFSADGVFFGDDVFVFAAEFSVDGVLSADDVSVDDAEFSVDGVLSADDVSVDDADFSVDSVSSVNAVFSSLTGGFPNP